MLPVWKGLGEANGKWPMQAFATGFAICQFASANWQTHRIRHRRMHFACKMANAFEFGKG